eukprot:CAMPEP_0168535430 /NCGR_PEP_ID=MMETSP0405-20121227/18694_1 /TAXON_ID=498012 /ORGANISM="Trichosphaerium sp, Strain Am-I-7 wt" /LENGTH=95 /DNA_ID=CAMNT_0008562733 /DNA_START=46 /DNA_END=333 /DNA_ORIENTATION=-
MKDAKKLPGRASVHYTDWVRHDFKQNADIDQPSKIVLCIKSAKDQVLYVKSKFCVVDTSQPTYFSSQATFPAQDIKEGMPEGERDLDPDEDNLGY